MADSLLAEIDWTDLDSAEMTTAVKLIVTALQERFNIGAMRLDGSYSTGGTVINPSDNILKNMFPYKTNSPRWTFNNNDPLADFTSTNLAAEDDLNHLLINAAQHYADIEKWDDAAINKDSGDTRFSLAFAADDPGTYASRLQEVTGYTSYPDLSVMAPEEVKKLYDMVVIMQYAIRNYAFSMSGKHRVVDGEFDKDMDPFFISDENDNGFGADFYNGGSSTDILVSNTTSYSSFKTGNGNLFGATSSTFDESTDSGTFNPIAEGLNSPYSIKFVRNAGSYRNFINAYQYKYITDWTTAQTAVGFIGLPLSYKGHSLLTSLTNDFPVGHDPSFSFPGTSTAVNQRYYETITGSGTASAVTVSKDNLMAGLSLPATVTTMPDNEEILVIADVSSNLRANMLEFWDGDGGFESYTAP